NPTLFETVHNRAWQVAASWFLTGEKNSFSPVKPLRPVNFAEGGWGALELAARYGELTLDPELFSPAATGGAQFASASSASTTRCLRRGGRANRVASRFRSSCPTADRVNRAAR